MEQEYANLQNEYNNLQRQYNSLQSQYNTLYNEYINLQRQYSQYANFVGDMTRSWTVNINPDNTSAVGLTYVPASCEVTGTVTISSSGYVNVIVMDWINTMYYMEYLYLKSLASLLGLSFSWVQLYQGVVHTYSRPLP